MSAPCRTLADLLSARRIGQEAAVDAFAQDGRQRSPFENDGDKISFSDGFRALADKTQVHDRVNPHGIYRNRLTHSIEVSRVGRSLGVALGARMISYHGLNSAPSGEAYWRVDPADIGHIVSAACLAHDVGNPPFGHEGEDAISNFFQQTSTGQRAVHLAGEAVGTQLCNHEGNAQGFRMITRSMGWRQQGGLNLTAATLGAFSKYPYPAQSGIKKYGLHQADVETFDFVASSTALQPRKAGGWMRHPLAWLMEAADDICYLTVDLEDAAILGMIGIDLLEALYHPIIGGQEIAAARALEPARRIQYMRSRMIRTLIEACVDIYHAHAEHLEAGTLPENGHGAGLLANTIHAAALSDIRQVSRDRIYNASRTRESRDLFLGRMTTVLERLVTDMLEVVETGTPPREGSSLFYLPQATLGLSVSRDASDALPWLLDQVTLMSERRVLQLHEELTK